jgi:hypothetical protein
VKCSSYAFDPFLSGTKLLTLCPARDIKRRPEVPVRCDVLLFVPVMRFTITGRYALAMSVRSPLPYFPGTLTSYQAYVQLSRNVTVSLVTRICELDEVLQVSVKTRRGRHSNMAVAVLCNYNTSLF